MIEESSGPRRGLRGKEGSEARLPATYVLNLIILPFFGRRRLEKSVLQDGGQPPIQSSPALTMKPANWMSNPSAETYPHFKRCCQLEDTEESLTLQSLFVTLFLSYNEQTLIPVVQPHWLCCILIILLNPRILFSLLPLFPCHFCHTSKALDHITLFYPILNGTSPLLPSVKCAEQQLS